MRDDGDGDTELQMRERTEMAYALTEPEAPGESVQTHEQEGNIPTRARVNIYKCATHAYRMNSA